MSVLFLCLHDCHLHIITFFIDYKLTSKKLTFSVLIGEQADCFGAKALRSISRPENLNPFYCLMNLNVRGQEGFLVAHIETVKQIVPSGRGQHGPQALLWTGHKKKKKKRILQWMTVGQGILHVSVPCHHEDSAQALQLWVNFRSPEKMLEPQYQELKSEEIQNPTKNGVTVCHFRRSLGNKV